MLKRVSVRGRFVPSQAVEVAPLSYWSSLVRLERPVLALDRWILTRPALLSAGAAAHRTFDEKVETIELSAATISTMLAGDA